MVELNFTQKQKQFFKDRKSLKSLVNQHLASDLGETSLSQYLDEFQILYNRFFCFYFFSYGENVFFSEEIFSSQLKNGFFPTKTKDEILSSPALNVIFSEKDFLLLKNIRIFLGMDSNKFFLTEELFNYKSLIDQQSKKINKKLNEKDSNFDDNWIGCFNQNSRTLGEFLVVRYFFFNFFSEISKNNILKEEIFKQLITIDFSLLLLLFSHIEFKQT